MLTISIPVLNQAQHTQETLKRLKSLQKNNNQYVIVDNGSNPEVRAWLTGLTDGDMVIRNDHNKGLPKAMNQAMTYNRKFIGNEYVFHTHTDVLMFEQDWDEKIERAIDDAKATCDVGVAGFFGALGIGTQEIYKMNYQMHQMVRTTPVSGDRCKLDPKIHHQYPFSTPWMKCAVLDGFGLVVKHNLRFDDSFGPHHMYDNDICLQSINRGYQNICVNIDVNHLGGRTDVGEDWATPFGKTKQEVHTEAHKPFYEKWRPGKNTICLPYRV